MRIPIHGQGPPDTQALRSPVRRHRGLFAIVASALAVAIATAACGSSSSTSSGGGSSSSSSSSGSASAAATSSSSASSGANVALAKQMVTADETPVTYGVTAKSTKPIPTGKTIAYINTGNAGGQTIYEAISAAAKVLGWKVNNIATDSTPASVHNAWSSAVQQSPDAVFGIGFNRTLYNTQLLQLEAKHIPFFDYSDNNVTGNGVTLVLEGGNGAAAAPAGSQMADWAVADTNGKANVLYVGLPTFVILNVVQSAFKAEYQKLCPSCGFSLLNIPITALGTTAPSLIVSYLRAHPSINYVVLSYDPISVGLPAALKAAGLNTKVKFVGEAPSPTNLGYVASGEEAATINQGFYELEAQEVDAAARYLTGQSIAPDQSLPPHYYWIETKNNLQSKTGFGPVDPNLYTKFKAALGVQ
jgi:ribose transport system substrate-binding protein